ncbi:hypothetical protein APHHGE2_1266 [Anaplasma phagocytophilum str. HGE2]|nr:hypothetical protein APHHGE2_1266 [Anaplasma phagocytophilum str. HGE2]
MFGRHGARYSCACMSNVYTFLSQKRKGLHLRASPMMYSGVVLIGKSMGFGYCVCYNKS